VPLGHWPRVKGAWKPGRIKDFPLQIQAQLLFLTFIPFDCLPE
jgi:hypothetical protein